MEKKKIVFYYPDMYIGGVEMAILNLAKRIYKDTDGEKTFTRVEKLSHEEKVYEVARLLGGTTVTDITLQNARELISGSK